MQMMRVMRVKVLKKVVKFPIDLYPQNIEVSGKMMLRSHHKRKRSLLKPQHFNKSKGQRFKPQGQSTKEHNKEICYRY